MYCWNLVISISIIAQLCRFLKPCTFESFTKHSFCFSISICDTTCYHVYFNILFFKWKHQIFNFLDSFILGRRHSKFKVLFCVRNISVFLWRFDYFNFFLNILLITFFIAFSNRFFTFNFTYINFRALIIFNIIFRIRLIIILVILLDLVTILFLLLNILDYISVFISQDFFFLLNFFKLRGSIFPYCNWRN